MATDEALLDASFRLGRPVLRFYGWHEEAATFGNFQRYADVAAQTTLRPLIRRPTGGGLVPHAEDWTYSLVFPPMHFWYRLRAVESYRNVHRWIQLALEKAGIAVELSPSPRKSPSLGQCFVGAEQFDLLHECRKIAGAAQRRNRHGLLIQGSLQMAGISVAREIWENAMLVTCPVIDSISWCDLVLDGELSERVRASVENKFGNVEYNQGR